jgi:hypothetical protein
MGTATAKFRYNEKPGLLTRIKEKFIEFKNDLKKLYRGFKKAIIHAGIVAALVSFFTGHIFSAIVIGGLTYIFWKRQDGVDELVGVADE